MSGEHDPELVRRLEEALLKLPRRQREIFLACRLTEMIYEEIGLWTGLSPRRVERQFTRALYKLDKQLDGRWLSWWERWY